MLRPRPEPSDLAASLVPRMGDTPFAPGVPREFYTQALADPSSPFRPGAGFNGPRAVVVRIPRDPAQEARDAAEQQAIADAVEGVLP